MPKKLLFLAVIISAIFCAGLYWKSSQASDWPSKNLNQTLNRHIIDPSVINSSKIPFSIDVPFNTQDMVTGGGYLYYSDGDSEPTIYALNATNNRFFD